MRILPQKNENEKVSIPKAKFRILRFRFSLRLKDVLFPIDGSELAEALARVGYSIQPKLPPARARMRISFSGEIARKNGIAIDGNSDRGILGVTAKSYDSAMTAYDEVRAIISNELKIDIEERSRFFEIIAEYKFDSVKNPLASIGKAFGGTRTLKDMSDIFSHRTSMYSLRLVSEGKVPNQEEWLDITIEPDLIKPDSTYNIAVVFRSSQKKIVGQFGKDLETRLSRAIDAIES